MRRILEESLSAISATTSFDGGLQPFFRALEQLGFSSVVYVFGERDPDTAEPYLEGARFWNTPHDEFERTYFEEDWQHNDAALDYITTYRRPLHWLDPQFQSGFDRNNRRIFSHVNDFGFRDGFTLPILSPDPGDLSALTLAHDRAHDRDFLTRFQHNCDTIALLLHWFHAFNVSRFRSAQSSSGPHTSGDVLTRREREALCWLAQGLTSSKIAERLPISERTVNLHIRNAMTKLRARNRAQAVARAIFLGEIEP